MALSTTILRRNLSRTELILAAAVIAGLVALFMQRMRSVEVAAEEAILTTRVQDMQSRLLGMRLQFVTAGIGDRADTLAEVVSEIAGADVQRVASARDIEWTAVRPGSWVYVDSREQLWYRTISGADFPGATGDPPHVRFQLSGIYADKKADSRAPRRLIGARVTREAAAGGAP